MAEEPVAKQPVIIDSPDIKTLFVDWIATAGVHDNVFNVTFGTLEYTIPQNDLARVVVATRLRFSRLFARNLHMMLGNMLADHPESGTEELPTVPPNIKLN